MSNANFSDSLKIITVDDSPIIAARLESMLSEMPCVTFAGNAQDISSALHLIGMHKPDVVILDIHLEADAPKANGIDLLVFLRKKYADLKIIMFTNLTGLHYKNTCLDQGADFFFDKSNDFEKIPSVLDTLYLTKIEA